MDCWQVLGLTPGASEKEVKKRYRKLALRYHPDRNPDPDSRQLFILISTAYELILQQKGRGFHYKSVPVSQQDPKSGRARDEQVRTRSQEERAQIQAEYYASASFDEFAESPIFRTAMWLDYVYDYIFLALGLLGIVWPWFYYWFHEPTKTELERGELIFSASNAVIVSIMAAFFASGIYHFLFKLQNKKILKR